MEKLFWRHSVLLLKKGAAAEENLRLHLFYCEASCEREGACGAREYN